MCRRISILLEQIKICESQTPFVTSPPQAPEPWQGSHSLQPHPQSILVPINRNSTSPHSESRHDNYSFFGEWSSFGLLLASPREELQQRSDIDLFLNSQNNRLFPGLTANYPGFPSMAVATGLFDVFARSVNVFFPVVETPCLERILQTTYRNEDVGYSDQNRQLFFSILAVAALVAKRSDPSLPSLARAYFEQAAWRYDVSCDHSSKASQIFIFQRTLLISVYILLNPGSGDIWRNLGFAIRLFFDLSHRSFVEGDAELRLFHMLTRTLYCLERYGYSLFHILGS